MGITSLELGRSSVLLFGPSCDIPIPNLIITLIILITVRHKSLRFTPFEIGIFTFFFQKFPSVLRYKHRVYYMYYYYLWLAKLRRHPRGGTSVRLWSCLFVKFWQTEFWYSRNFIDNLYPHTDSAVFINVYFIHIHGTLPIKRNPGDWAVRKQFKELDFRRSTFIVTGVGGVLT